MNMVTLSSKGDITIPQNLRDEFGLSGGMTFEITKFNNHIALIPQVIISKKHHSSVEDFKKQAFYKGEFVPEDEWKVAIAQQFQTENN